MSTSTFGLNTNTIDALTSGANVSIGATNANTINIGRTGQTAILKGSATFQSTIVDASSNTGTAGQFLSSTGTSILWATVSASSSSVQPLSVQTFTYAFDVPNARVTPRTDTITTPAGTVRCSVFCIGSGGNAGRGYFNDPGFGNYVGRTGGGGGAGGIVFIPSLPVSSGTPFDMIVTSSGFTFQYNSAYLNYTNINQFTGYPVIASGTHGSNGTDAENSSNGTGGGGGTVNVQSGIYAMSSSAGGSGSNGYFETNSRPMTGTMTTYAGNNVLTLSNSAFTISPNTVPYGKGGDCLIVAGDKQKIFPVGACCIVVSWNTYY